MKTALVIGGTGFIGLNLVDALLARGVKVRVTRRRRSITVYLRRRDVELVDGCLEDIESLRAAMSGCDAVFMAAGYYPRYSLDRAGAIEEGVSGLRNACRAALDVGAPRFVYTSSIGLLGGAPDGRPVDERDVPEEAPADSTYRAVKWEMERELARHVEAGLPATSLLAGGCVGPWDVRVGTAALLVGAVRGELAWWVDGFVNLVDVGDLADAHIAAASEAGGQARYCVAGHTVRVGELLEQITGRFGGSFPPLPVAAADARLRADDEERAVEAARRRAPFPREMVDLITSGADISSELAARDLGVRFRPLESSLDRAHEWFVRYRYLPDTGRGAVGALAPETA